jgi:hypothetical protein
MAPQRRLFGVILAIFAVIAGFPAVTARTHG